MYTEEDLLPISALQHLSFCERQWGLIHLEGAWLENRLTAEGRQLHERVHEAPGDVRGDLRTARGLRLRSLRLGLVGIADVVEFRRLKGEDVWLGIRGIAPSLSGRWNVEPVEYKRGRPKSGNCDTVQLCAQAICLEEMIGVHIPVGQLFYARPRRRLAVHFTENLRNETCRLADRLHKLHERGETPPPPKRRQQCRSCSLAHVCLPEISRRRSATRYLAAVLGGDDPP